MKKDEKLKNYRGWTLLEVLIVITISAVAGTLLVNILFSSNELFFDQSAQISHGLSLNQANSEIADAIRSSLSPASQYPASGLAQYTTDSDTLVLKLPAIDGNNNVIELVYDYAVIDRDPGNGNVLRIQIIPDAQSTRHAENKVLSTALDHLEFSYLDVSNNTVSPASAARVSYTIYLLTKSGFSENESSASGTVNIKNI